MSKLPTSKVDQKVGQRIKQRRKEMHLTVAALSEMIGISSQQLSRYERGENKINLEHFILIAERLHTPMSWFFVDFEISLAENFRSKYHLDLEQRLLQQFERLTLEKKRALILFLDQFN